MRAIIEAGQARSHDIAITTIRPKKKNLHQKPDLIILADIFNFPHTLRSLGCVRRFSTRFLYDICRKEKFIHFSNAYSDVCNLPHLPCSGDAAGNCRYKSAKFLKRNIAIRDFKTQCFQVLPIVKQLFARSALNVFVSPLHAKTIYNMLGLKTTNHPCYIMKPVIDASLFKNKNIKRNIDYLFVGLIGEAKGLNNLRQQYRDKNICLIGRIAPGERLDFGEYLGFVPYKQIPEYMNRAKNFVFLPRWPEPQGRVVVEAALCGCKIIANENVGALSFDFNIANSDNFSNSCEEFWDNIESLN